MSSVSLADKIKLLDKNEEALQARAALVANAKHDIYIEYFEFGDDDFSLTALSLIREAALRGVKVKILMDSMHNSLSNSELAAVLGVAEDSKALENIEIRLFNPFRSLNVYYQTYRNHDKLLNVDGEYMIVGGRNAAESYFGKSKIMNFKDADALVTGKSAQDSKDYFLKLWNINPDVKKLKLYQYSQQSINAPQCSDAISPNCFAPEREISKQRSRITELYNNYKSGKSWVKEQPISDMLADIEDVGEIKFAFNDPTQEMRNVEKKLATQIMDGIINNAQKSVTITTPYLYPTESEMASLRVLAARGVKIKIVTNSLASTDMPLVHAALLTIKKQLADMGVELYLYKGPEVLHAKTAVIDGKVAFIGSFNFDRRSANLNREIGIRVGNFKDEKVTAFTEELVQFIDSEIFANSVVAIKDGKEINLEAFDALVPQLKRQELEFVKKYVGIDLIKESI